MNFNPKQTTPTVKVAPSKAPIIEIAYEALVKMFHYVDQCKDEIGWLGTVSKEGNKYTIEDTFLFEQEVHATTTEITPEGLQSFAEELLTQPDGMDVWNSIRMWGHSHVNMGTNPSGQDDSQMVEFSNIGQPFFIRLIANKKGDIRIDLYDYDAGIVFLDLQWQPKYEAGMDFFIDQMWEIQRQFENAKKELLIKHAESTKQEIGLLVKKKTYTVYGAKQSYGTSRNYGLAGTGDYESEYGYYLNGRWIRRTEEERKKYVEEREVKPVQTQSKLNYFYSIKEAEDGLGLQIEDFIGLTSEQVKEVLEEYGYIDATEQDVRYTMLCAQQVEADVYGDGGWNTR